MPARKKATPKKPRTKTAHRKLVTPPELPQAPTISPPTPPVVIPTLEVTPTPPPQVSNTPVVSPPLTSSTSVSPVPEMTAPNNSPVLVTVPDTSPTQVQQLVSLPTETASISSITDTQPPPSSIPLTMSKSKSKLPWLALAALLLVGLGVAGWALYSSRKVSKSISSSNLKPTPVQVSTTSVVSPSPVLDRSEIKVQILNGSGTPGAASVAKDKLENLGYESIDTGNAEAYDFENVEISLKPDKAEFFNLLVSDLGSAYSVASSAGTLSSSSSYDAVIIIGQE